MPVMADEAIDLLKVKKGGWYVDCTLGGGGHSEQILKQKGNLIGIDQDPDAIEFVKKKFLIFNLKFLNKYQIIQGNFANLKELVNKAGLEKVDGILFDLGTSTHQLLTPERGFSFNTDAVLDMRMDINSQSVTAKDLINGLSEKELVELFFKLGEENFSRPIARAIVSARRLKLIEMGSELAGIVLKVRGKKEGKNHPATKVFQALRIAVNDELNNLKSALPQAVELLNKEGRLVVISFHSLEDRIVKNYFKEEGKQIIKIITKKPLTPTREEVNNNQRSRSAKLRAVEKI